MLYFDTSLELEGLTLFRDYNEPKRFYYMPRAPHLTVENGAPMFQLLIYRRDITDNPDFREGDRPGGGFLTMTVDLGVPQGVLDAVRGELEGRVDGDVDLVPVPFESGNVRVSALGVAAGNAPALEGGGAAEGEAGEAQRGPRFVENILGSARPSLYGDNRAVFTIELSHEGAQLMRASLQEPGATQVGVIYDLQYRGLMPAYEGKITINFRQAYSHLRSRFTVNTLWFRADIDAEVERLTKEGHIKIESVDYLQSDPVKLAERATQLTQLAKELATWSFFRPGLQPGNVLATDRGDLQAADPTTAAQQVTAGFSTPLDVALTGAGRSGPGASPVPGRSPRTGGIGGQDPVEGAENPTGAAPGQTGQTGGQQGEGQGSGQRPLTAVEQWNRAGRPQAAFLLRSLSQEEQQTITWDLRQIAAAQRAAAPQGAIRMLAGAAGLPGRIREVDLNDPFFERISGTVTTTADLETAGVGSMVVKLRYGVRDDGSAPKDTQEIVLRRTGDSGAYSFFMDRRRSVELEYQVVVSYKAGYAIGSTETQTTSPWIRTTTRNLDIDPRSVGAVFPVNLVLGSVDWASVQNVQSTVSYDGGGQHAERTVVLTQGASSALVPVRPPQGGGRGFKVRNVFFYGGVQETVEVQGEGDALVVVNPPAARAVPVSVSSADPLGRFRKIAVELAYAAPGQSEQTRLLELSGDGGSGSWTFFRPSESSEPRYRYRVTLFGTDGTTTSLPWQETVERQLIVGDRFDGMLRVDVRFLGPNGGDLAANGYQGALLTLEYPDAPDGTDGLHQEFFTGAPRSLLWRVPVLRGKPRTYKYDVRYIRNDGNEVTRNGQSRDEVLLLQIPPQGA